MSINPNALEPVEVVSLWAACEQLVDIAENDGILLDDSDEVAREIERLRDVMVAIKARHDV